jgi:hypothetical protein
MIRERPTAAPHLGTLAREIAARLFDVGSTTPASPTDDVSCETANRRRLAPGFMSHPG